MSTLKTKENKYNIAVIPGDGIGSEVMESTIAVLDNLDIDFNYIYGEAGDECLEKTGHALPEETIEDVRYTMEEILKLKPESITIHSLAIKRASKLSEWIAKNGKETLKSSDETMKIAAAGAAEMGLVPYYLYRQKNMSGNLENVGFSSEGKEGIYNILIMEELQTIVACGAGCVTKRVFFEDGKISKLERCENVKEVPMYCEKIEEMIARKETLFSD